MKEEYKMCRDIHCFLFFVDKVYKGAYVCFRTIREWAVVQNKFMTFFYIKCYYNIAYSQIVIFSATTPIS